MSGGRSPPRGALRFAILGDLHCCSRVPQGYVRSVLADAERVGCAFVAFLGDVFDGTCAPPLELARESGLPIVWQKGDHEFFSEWGRTGAVLSSRLHPLVGGAPDPLAFFRGAVPRFEALTGCPTAWAFTLRGVLFVVAHNGKNCVWHDWQLRWLSRLLDEHRHRTTVVLSHRTLDELGERAEELRRLVSRHPQVLLFCDAHVHEPRPVKLFGSALEVGAETAAGGGLTYEGGWYVVVEIAEGAVRVYRRRVAEGGLELLHEREVETTLGGATGEVHLAFLMSDGSVRFNPALGLRGARLRVWGVAQEQLLPLPGEGGWRAGEGVSLRVVEGGGEWRKLGVERVFEAAVGAAGEAALAEVEVPYRFDPEPARVGVAGTLARGTQVVPLLLAKAPAGARLRLEVEALLDGGGVESRHWVEAVSDGGIAALQAETGHVYLGPHVGWRWEGVGGRVEVDGIPQPRQASRLKLRLKVSNAGVGAAVQFIGFAFPESGGFFTPAPRGRSLTRGAAVRVGGRGFELGDVGEGSFREVELGELAGGEPIALSCGGSKLALVELVGEADALMLYAVRRARVAGEGVVELGEAPLAEALRQCGWGVVGGTGVWRLSDCSYRFVPLRS